MRDVSFLEAGVFNLGVGGATGEFCLLSSPSSNSIIYTVYNFFILALPLGLCLLTSCWSDYKWSVLNNSCKTIYLHLEVLRNHVIIVYKNYICPCIIMLSTSALFAQVCLKAHCSCAWVSTTGVWKVSWDSEMLLFHYFALHLESLTLVLMLPLMSNSWLNIPAQR